MAAADQGVAADNAAQSLAHRIAALVDAERETARLQVLGFSHFCNSQAHIARTIAVVF